ncbi:hypothetical protein QZM26_11340 [Burkholderia multivorans]|nr:hypothetical protein [Burkholderia multivorans]
MANAILPGCDARPIEIIRTELINEQAAYWARRQPAPLFAGSGFSDEALKQTTLTRYLDFDTWTPAAAAMLVCGLQAPIDNGQLCTEIPAGRVKGLDGLWKSEQNCTAIADAERVLGIWRSQVNPPARVRPLDFVEWCQARGFDIAWLRSVKDDVLGKERAAAIRTVTRRGEKWSDAELRTLLDESKMPDFTQKAAAEKYGVTPQRISELLKRAEDKFETPAKASPFPTTGTQIRKVKGRQYK